MPEAILSSVEFQMSLLMFVALAGYLLAYRVNQSAVVGIILAGVVVGPSLLGLVTYTDFVAGLAQLGAVVLLFTIGLEFELKEITRPRYLIIALVGVLVPWGAGFGIAKAFDFNFNTAVFIGTAATATSIAITANVLDEMGKLQTPAAKAILGAAIIDDVLALLALTVSEQLVAGALSPVQLLLSSGKAVGFLIIAGVPARILLRQVLARLDATSVARKYPESIFIFAMMVAFLYSMAAGFVGLSAVVGSFLAGVCFAGTELKRSHIFREGSEHLKVIFASIFFISLGVLLDLKTITPALLIFVAVLTVVAGLSKVVGCGFPAWLMGFKRRDSLTIGIGMVPRGEIAMIVALIGLSQGFIEPDIYAGLVLMSLLTTVIPPLILRNLLYR